MSGRNYARPGFWIGVCALALFAGCSPPAEKAPGNAPAPANQPAGAKQIRVAGIGFQDDQFFKLVEMGMKAKAAELGVEFAPNSSAGSLDKEISLVDALIAKKVDALCVAPLSQKASVPALKKAHDANIKVVTFDSAIDADFPASSIRSDQRALGSPTGEAAKRYIETKLGGKAKIAILSYMALAPEPASQRTGGFEESVKSLPGVEIVARQDAWLAPKAVTVVENILTAHPDVNIIWAANEGGTVGAVMAVKNAGKAGKVVVFGTDISEQIGGFLLSPDNILQAVTGQKPFDIGGMAVETAVKTAKGETVEKQVALPGILLTREKPDEATKYLDYLRGLTK